MCLVTSNLREGHHQEVVILSWVLSMALWPARQWPGSGFLQDVGAQTPWSLEKISDLLPGIGLNPEPPMDIGGEAGLFLLHGQSDVAAEVVWPTTRSPEFDEGPDFWVLVLVVSHAGGGQVDGVNLKFESRPGEKVGRHVDAFLVLNDEIELQ